MCIVYKMREYIIKKYRKHLGVELEFLIKQKDGYYISVENLLKKLKTKENVKGTFKMEAFTCTIEYITPVCRNAKEAIDTIKHDINILNITLNELDLEILHGNYFEIPKEFNKSLSKEMANIRNTQKKVWKNIFTPSLHVHIGVGSLKDAKKIYNCWVNNFDNFVKFYDKNYKSKRFDKIIEINTKLTGDKKPTIVNKEYKIPNRPFNYQDDNGRTIYPYRYYYYIFSKHGTVENRIADCINDFEKMYKYIEYVYDISCVSIEKK